MAELRPLEVEQFERLSSYPFSTDREFAAGLSIILGHPELPASETEINRSDDLTLQAKCFYFSRYIYSYHPVVYNIEPQHYSILHMYWY